MKTLLASFVCTLVGSIIVAALMDVLLPLYPETSTLLGYLVGLLVGLISFYAMAWASRSK